METFWYRLKTTKNAECGVVDARCCAAHLMHTNHSRRESPRLIVITHHFSRTSPPGRCLMHKLRLQANAAASRSVYEVINVYAQEHRAVQTVRVRVLLYFRAMMCVCTQYTHQHQRRTGTLSESRPRAPLQNIQVETDWLKD